MIKAGNSEKEKVQVENPQALYYKLTGRMSYLNRKSLKAVFVLILSLFTFHSLLFTFAQLATGTNPETVADEAVSSWLKRSAFNPYILLNKPQDEVCKELSAYISDPPPPEGTQVNLADRRELESDTPSNKTYSYPASFSSGQLAIVEVKLEQKGDVWEATEVGFNLNSSGLGSLGGLYDAVQRPFSYILFSLFSLSLIYFLMRPSGLRRQLVEGRSYLKEHRRIVWFTVALLYGLFAIGFVTGQNLSEVCAQLFLNFFQASLEEIGAGEATASLNIARLATVIFFQNFTFGAVISTFGMALLFGIPAYFLNAIRFYVIGIPFGYQGFGGLLELLLALILFVVELMAYVLITAGGGMLLITLIRQGFKGLNLAFRKLAMMLPIAMLLLVIGAWYEALVIIVALRLSGS